MSAIRQLGSAGLPPLLVLLACTAALAGPVAAESDDAVVIEFGDKALTRGQLDRRFDVALRLLAHRQGITLADQDPSAIENLRQQYLEKHATELVLLREAERRQLTVSDTVANEALAGLFATQDEQDSFLADLPSGCECGHELLAQVIHDEKTIELLTEHMLKEIKIPAGDVITLHHDIKDTLATPEQVCVRHIQAASVEAANEVLADLEAGASFEALAKAKSIDQASAASGGDLGCFERSRSAARSAFQKAAFAAREGELTGPVESRFGHHILVVYEHILPREPTLNEAYVEIERELALEKLPQRIQALVSESGMRIHPENYQASTLSEGS